MSCNKQLTEHRAEITGLALEERPDKYRYLMPTQHVAHIHAFLVTRLVLVFYCHMADIIVQFKTNKQKKRSIVTIFDAHDQATLLVKVYLGIYEELCKETV